MFGCLLDAFDLVDHGNLFHKLLNRGLPTTVVRFLLLWYQSQHLNVRWNGQTSESFGVSSGVRQGGVLSPVLFAIYVDDFCWSWSAVVLDVIVGVILWELFVMQMTWHC